MPLPVTLRPLLALNLISSAAVALAQPAPAASAPAPARAASAPAPARAASAPAAAPQRIEITGGRDSDTDERRRATASKIVIGREQIDKFGDATLGEVLRRLPGVTTPGAPGRGGPPRMRGLGGGFTQLLIDGQRIPPGFSLESLTPEQVERIEILRAPTAETGARAIAGTINIITREGFKRRLNDLRLGLGVENGQVSRGVFWTHNDSIDNFIYNLSGSLFNPHRRTGGSSSSEVTDLATGALLEKRSSQSSTDENRLGANLSGRLQWRLGVEGSGDSLTLMPMVFHTEAKTDARFTQQQPVVRPTTLDLYDFGDSHGESRFTNARLGAQYRQRLGAVRLELQGNAGRGIGRSDSLRHEYDNGGATPRRVLEDHTRSREDNLTLNLKASGVSGGGEAGGEHSLVGGGEIDAARRTETRINLQDGRPLLTDFGDNLQASTLRLAAFVQDEWNPSPSWGFHAGLRWEGITTRGDTGQDGAESRPTNRTSVWTPLLHAVWKPDPKKRDQIRVSLTRSYRSPSTGNLIARPSINRDYDPALGPNPRTSPDSAGNPGLKPELATGIDIAAERYLDGGGVLSANLFRRNISNLIRSQIAQEQVSWSPFDRWVRRAQNIGQATTSGLELEAKFRLDQAVEGALPVELRANASFYTSRVKSVPGPDNRLDQQAKATANLGADYRLRSLPLTLGGNLNWVPATTTRLEAEQTVTTSTKRVWDGFALWTFSPTVGLRLLANNLVPRDFSTTTVTDVQVASGDTERTTGRSTGPSYVNWQLRLELKL
ncbi:MAG: TonB-dependent receptor [Rubrivivax sp.]|nr:TonB-dependent receptor [Rubrivivax sp.]